MEWFSGDIAEAVRISKEKHVIFVVFIDGKTDESLLINELLNNAAIASKLSDPKRYLSVRIESNTDTYRQFAQIYRLVPVPSIFFIGELGQPIEIVAGKVESVEALQKRILVAEGIFYQKSQSDEGTPSPGSSNSLPSPKPSSTLTATKDEKKTAPSKMEERMSKEDVEMQKLKEERKREKAQDEEARRRVLEQIKLDRLRRQDAQLDVVTPKNPSPSQSATPAPIVRTLPDMTRIQFRKPTGESTVDTFKSEGPFGDVWKYAKASMDIKDFVLATAMPPRRVFSAEHADQTLNELNLAPSAVLLVIPLTKPSLIGGGRSSDGGGVVAKAGTLLSTIYWTVFTSILSLWNRLRGKQPNNRTEPAVTETEAPGPNIGSEVLQKRNLARYNLGPSGSTTVTAGDPQSEARSSTSSTQKKQGSNIHRLKDYDSDDNESNTYNGNSTQQM